MPFQTCPRIVALFLANLPLARGLLAKGEQCEGEVWKDKLAVTVEKLLKFCVAHFQPFSMKFGGTQSANLTVLHLPRFYIPYESFQIKTLRSLIQVLEKSRNREMEAIIAKNMFGKHCISSLTTREYSHIVEQTVG